MQTEKFVLVDLSLLDEDALITCSQAKQILKNLGEFQHIVLDFNKIRLVGQGFVDEVFRVYAIRNPGKYIEYRNADPSVKFMIERGLAYKSRKH